MRLAITAIFVMALFLFLPGCQKGAGGGSGSNADSSGPVDGKTAKTMVADGARLIDVRTVGEFSRGHIDGAVNIPVNEVGSRLSEIDPQGGPVIVYCQSGGRSAKAAQILRGAGYSEVYDLGGIGNW